MCVHALFHLPYLNFLPIVCTNQLPDVVPMAPQKLVILLTTLMITLTGGAIGLFAAVGVVKWLMQTEPEDAGILRSGA
jgi:hypothetical protein